MKFVINNWKSSLIICAIFFIFTLFKTENIYDWGYSDEDFEELERKYLSELERIDKLLNENHLLRSEMMMMFLNKKMNRQLLPP